MKAKIWSICVLILCVNLLSFSSQKVVISKSGDGIYKKVSNTYTTWKEAVGDKDFKSARKLSKSIDERRLIGGYELLLNNNIDKAEQVLIGLWKAKSIYRDDALAILYKYYFYHTEWEKIMKLTKITGVFPKGYESVKDYYKFPAEKFVFLKKEIISVPIKKFNYGKTPVISVYVNGIKKDFIVDTGVSISAVSSDVAQKCGVVKGTTSMGMRDANNVTKKKKAIPG